MYVIAVQVQEVSLRYAIPYYGKESRAVTK